MRRAVVEAGIRKLDNGRGSSPARREERSTCLQSAVGRDCYLQISALGSVPSGSASLVHAEESQRRGVGVGWGGGSVPGWSKITPRSILKVPIRAAIKGRVCEWKAWRKVALVWTFSICPLMSASHP